jgi:hypothetical protein
MPGKSPRPGVLHELFQDVDGCPTGEHQLVVLLFSQTVCSGIERLDGSHPHPTKQGNGHEAQFAR